MVNMGKRPQEEWDELRFAANGRGREEPDPTGAMQGAVQRMQVGAGARTGGGFNAGNAARGYTDPGKITQSYYTNPTNNSNYESGRPIYGQSDAVKDAAAELAEKEKNKPGDYQSQYEQQIQDLINKALNREKFHYDFSTDPTYQQYADKYQQQGKIAMKGAMGESAALTGGYGNSFAQSAGQQTYQGYMSSLNDMIPQLRDAAYQTYQGEGTDMRNNLSMLQQQEAADYAQYRDTVVDYQTELQYYYGKYNDMSQAEYNHYQNDVGAWERDRDYWAQKDRDKQAQANWQSEFNLALSKAKGGGRSGGGGGKKKNGKSAGKIPETYEEFVAMAGTNSAGIASGDRELSRINYGKKPEEKYKDYKDYLAHKWAEYN